MPTARKTIIAIPKLFKKDRATAVIVAARLVAQAEYKKLQERDKVMRQAAKKK